MGGVTEQQVFMVFFAIIWGAVANVQPRWKAFQWPLFRRHCPATKRVLLSVVVLNILPLLLFAYVFWALKHDSAATWSNCSVAHLVVHGILPAFPLFGCYRLWLAIVEAYPDAFYSSKGAVPQKYEHIEPTYRTKAERCNSNAKGRNSTAKDLPIVYLGATTARANLIAALSYAIIGVVAPWIAI